MTVICLSRSPPEVHCRPQHNKEIQSKVWQLHIAEGQRLEFRETKWLKL
jgi:hypothetical protein